MVFKIGILCSKFIFLTDMNNSNKDYKSELMLMIHHGNVRICEKYQIVWNSITELVCFPYSLIGITNALKRTLFFPLTDKWLWGRVLNCHIFVVILGLICWRFYQKGNIFSWGWRKKYLALESAWQKNR